MDKTYIAAIEVDDGTKRYQVQSANHPSQIGAEIALHFELDRQRKLGNKIKDHFVKHEVLG